jgi:hypothetical protein
MAIAGVWTGAGDLAIANRIRPLRPIAAAGLLTGALGVALLSGHMVDAGLLKASLPYLVNIRPDSASGFAITRAELILTFARSIPRPRLAATD